MSRYQELVGSWNHVASWNSEDYLAVYEISGNENHPLVKAHDLSDGEEFEISEVEFSNSELRFVSYMPSTKRRGINKFSLSESGRIISEFTFTVVEYLEKNT